MPPMFILGAILLIYLPASQRYIALLIPIIFWMIYYTWIFIERKKEELGGKKSDK